MAGRQPSIPWQVVGLASPWEKGSHLSPDIAVPISAAPQKLWVDPHGDDSYFGGAA